MKKKLLSFDDLLAAERLRTCETEIESLGAVVLHELSAAEQYACLSKHSELCRLMESETPDGASQQLELHIVEWAGRIIKGDMPNSEQVELLRKNLSADALSEIFNKGLNFNAANGSTETEIGGKEEAEKN